MARSKNAPEADDSKSDLADEAEVISPEPVEAGEAPEGETAVSETEIKAENEDAADDETPPEAEIETETEAVESVAMEEPAAEPAPQPEPRKRSVGGFLATVTGGILAAVIGFGAARYVVPEGWPFPGTGGGEDTLAASLADQEKKIIGLEDELKRLQAALANLPEAETGDASAALSALETRIGKEAEAMSGQVTEVAGKIASLEARLTEVEARPASGGGGGDTTAAVQAYEQELTAMREELAAQRAENEKMAGNIASVADDAQSKIDAAAARAQQLEQRAALLRVQTALETGDAFQAALAALGTDIPEVLSQNAATGVPTLAALQDSFPPAAREALSASLREKAGGSTTERVSAFLRSQLNVRSLEPREGSDPDAVLSRAEADVRLGDLDAALTEIAALPQPGQEAMADWVALAKKRVEVLAAADSLTNSLNQN